MRLPILDHQNDAKGATTKKVPHTEQFNEACQLLSISLIILLIEAIIHC